MSNLIIIEAPSNLGLKQLNPDRQPGVRKLPEWLRHQGFYERVKPDEVIHLTPPPYSMHLDEEAGVRNADAIADYSERLSNVVKETIDRDLFPLVIGGDCSILIGCTLGLRKIGRYGLFFIDGHTDYVIPYSSHSKGAAGMDLAIVTGNGHHKLTNIDSLRPYIAEADTLAFGNRYYNEDYVALILKSDIKYFDLAEIRKQGICKIAKAYITYLKTQGIDSFWIHFDVDVLNNELIPCVDSPQADGLSYEEIKLLLAELFLSNMVAGIDITILDPDLDKGGIFTKRFVEEITSVFNVDLIINNLK